MKMLWRFLTLAVVLTLTVAGLGRAATTDTDWLMYNGSYTGDRYSALDQINKTNAGSLHPVCAFQLGELGPMEAGPVIHNGVMFVTSMDNTFALDARTCKQIWKYAYTSTGLHIGRLNRGVAVLDGRVFRGTPDSHMIALDEKTGSLLWNVPVTDSSDGSSTIAAPVAWNGKVYMGIAGGDLGARGKMFAFDAADGHQLWSFDLVPTGNEFGANTWGHADSALTGGGATWTNFTLDTQNHTIFVPVGNPGPDFSTAYRPGDNLFTCSIVALDANTGKLQWYYQVIPHDYHDWDQAAAPAIFTAANGKRMITFAGKNGFLYTLDYASHKLLNKVAVTTIANQDAPLTIEGTHYCPSIGGTEWNGPAYSPLDKLTYVDAVDWCTTTKLGEVRYIKGHTFLGSGNGYGQSDKENSGWLTAVDPITGKTAWKYHASLPMVAAVTPTAGGVVFAGEMAGDFDAFDSANGKKLYSFNTGGAIAGGIAPYTIDGKEYIAVTSGNQSRTSIPTLGSPMVYVFSL